MTVERANNLLATALSLCLDHLPDDAARPLYDRIALSWRSLPEETIVFAGEQLEMMLALSDSELEVLRNRHQVNE